MACEGTKRLHVPSRLSTSYNGQRPLSPPVLKLTQRLNSKCSLLCHAPSQHAGAPHKSPSPALPTALSKARKKPHQQNILCQWGFDF